jgi:hypothetical protein
MLGDGDTEYDYAHDGDKGSIGGCSVSILCYLLVLPNYPLPSGEFPLVERDNKTEADVP